MVARTALVLVSGAPAELPSGDTLTGAGITALTGDVTATGPGSVAATIAAGAVTLAKQANLAANSLQGNNTGSAATPMALTVAQVKTLLNLTGTNSGDQTITLTGDVTGSGAGSFAATIANSAVSLAKMAAVATGTLFYRKTAATGAPEVQTLATLKTDLGLTGTNAGDQTITLTGDITGSGTGSFDATIANSAVSNAKAAQMPTLTIKGNNTGGTANAADLTAAQAAAMLPALVGDSGSGGTKGLVPAPAAGDAAANKVLGAGGAWVVPAAATTFAADREVAADKAVPATDSRIRGVQQINYILNPDAEINATGWNVYADAAGSQPVDGTGGSPTNMTFARSVSTAQRGSAGFLFSKTGGVSSQGQGFSFDFTIDGSDTSTRPSVSFEMVLSSGAYAAGALSVWVYDVTNSTLCPMSNNIIDSVGRVTLQFYSSASTSYRLIVHCGTTGTADMYVRFDSFYVGPTWLANVNAMTDYIDAGAITIGATVTAPTKGAIAKDSVRYRRTGDSGEFDYEFDMTGAGTAGSGEYLYTLPAGLSFASSVTFSTAGDAVATKLARGIGGVSNNTVRGLATIIPYDATRFRIIGELYSSTHTFLSSSYYQLSAGVKFHVQFTAPIAGWSGSVAVQPGSRYQWAQRYGASATRVTVTPARLGQYRFRINGVDSAPSTLPTQANGIYVYGTGTSVTQFDIFVGAGGKVTGRDSYLSAGRTGILLTDTWYSAAIIGVFQGYDPVTGVVSLAWREYVGTTDALALRTTGYVDILIADDPVPLALASTVYFIARTASTQSLTANVTNIIYGTVDSAFGGGYDAATGIFTCPVAGMYHFICNFAASTLLPAPRFYKNGTLVDAGSTAGGSSYGANISSLIMLAAGDTMSVRSSATVSLAADAEYNRFAGARIG